jgi:hypothetical protein
VAFARRVPLLDARTRGLTDATLDVYEGILTELLDALGDDVRLYSAEALRAFVERHGSTPAKKFCCSITSRFKRSRNRHLSRAIPPGKERWSEAKRNRKPVKRKTEQSFLELLGSFTRAGPLNWGIFSSS